MSEDSKSRRKRRGDYQAPVHIPPIVPDPIARQIPAEDFAALISRAEAFAQRRFGPILPNIGVAFFQGRTQAEVRDEGLQAAFRAYCLYGFRDPQGIRIIDMFAAAGIPPKGEVARALTAARQARFCFFEVLERNPRTKQLRVSNWTTDAEAPANECDVLDTRSYDHLELGDVMAGWYAPVGGLWRPLGAITLVKKARSALLRAGLEVLQKSQPQSLDDFSQRGAMPLFWLAYRIANVAEPEA